MTQTISQATAGIRLHTVTRGTLGNDLIICLHPAFGDHHCFDHQIEALAAHYRVIALDMVGHGQSQFPMGTTSITDTSEFIASLIANEGYSHAHLVGVSLGSLIAQDFAARYPSQVKTVTVVGGYSIFGVDKAIRKAQILEMVKWVPFALLSMSRFRRYVARNTTIVPAAEAAFYQSAQSFTRRSFQALSRLNQIFRPDAGPKPYPLNLMVGDHDQPVILQSMQAWHQREPTSEYRIVPNAGHCANMDNPQTFNQMLEEFLSRHQHPLSVS